MFCCLCAFSSPPAVPGGRGLPPRWGQGLCPAPSNPPPHWGQCLCPAPFYPVSLLRSSRMPAGSSSPSTPKTPSFRCMTSFIYSPLCLFGFEVFYDLSSVHFDPIYLVLDTVLFMFVSWLLLVSVCCVLLVVVYMCLKPCDQHMMLVG